MKLFVAMCALCLSAIAFGQDAATAAAPAVATGLMAKAQMWIEVLSQVVFGLTILATIVARVIPGKKDDEAVAGVVTKFSKVMHMLPTWGVNPRTKALETALDEMKKQSTEVK